MNVIQMSREIVVIPNDMIVKAVLPKRRAKAVFLPEPPARVALHGRDDGTEVFLAFGAKQPVPMIRKYDVRHMPKPVRFLHTPDRGNERCYGCIFRE